MNPAFDSTQSPTSLHYSKPHPITVNPSLFYKTHPFPRRLHVRENENQMVHIVGLMETMISDCESLSRVRDLCFISYTYSIHPYHPSYTPYYTFPLHHILYTYTYIALTWLLHLTLFILYQHYTHSFH